MAKNLPILSLTTKSDTTEVTIFNSFFGLEFLNNLLNQDKVVLQQVYK